MYEHMAQVTIHHRDRKDDYMQEICYLYLKEREREREKLL